MYEGFSESSKRVLRAAQEEARRSGHGSYGPEHILLGLLREKHAASQLLLEKGLALRDARFEVEKLLGRSSAVVPQDILFNPQAKVVLRTAAEAAGPGSEAEPHHLLLGLLREQGGPLQILLSTLGINVSELFFEVKDLCTRLSPIPEPVGVPAAESAAAAGTPPTGTGGATTWASLPKEERQVTQYRWSPDGRRVAMTTVRGLWVIERDAAGRQVFLGAGQLPAWSPDGRLLAFFRNRELLLWDGPANRTEVLDDQAMPRFDHPWSPDGGLLAFVHMNNLMVWSAETRQIRVVTHLTGAHMAQFEWLPPSGELITFLNNNVLWTASLDGSGARPLLS